MRSRWLLQVVGAALFLSWINPAAGFNGHIPDTYAYEVFFDIDSDDSTGCDVNADDDNFTGPVTGIEYVLISIIRRHPTSAEVDDVRLARCVAGSLMLQEVVDTGDWAAGLENGIGGADIVEVRVPRASIGDPSEFTLGFHTTRFDFNDVLLTKNGQPDGETIVFELPPGQEVPALSLPLLGLLGVLLMGVAWLSFRRKGRAWAAMAVLTLVASIVTTAFAVTISLDGNIADWAGIPPIATDTLEDSTADDDAEDIVAAFVTADGTNIYFRLDVVNLAPVVCGNNAIETGEDCELDQDCMPETESLDRGGAAEAADCSCIACQCVNCDPD